MRQPTTKSRQKDERILGALAGGPKSTRELGDALRLEVWQAWAEKHGYTFDWGSDKEIVGARILAMREADELGLPYLMPDEIYARLVNLEWRGLVERIQIDGHRPMLWRVA